MPAPILMHYVIIGNGVAGITAAFALRKRDHEARITVIGGESDYYFSRTALMYAFLDRMTLRDLEPFERKVYDAQRIERIRAWVTAIDPAANTLTLGDGRQVPYNRLLLATGSVPRRVPWPGLEKITQGAVHFVSLQDLAECERLAATARRAVVAGGGLIGVELVECLLHHGIEVDFLVRDSWYWPMALDPAEGALIAAHLRRHGVRLHLDHEIKSVSPAPDGRLASVQSTQGTEFPCDILGIAIGVRPAIDWLQAALPSLACNRGIRVSPAFATSLPDIWAAGDCAEFSTPSGTAVEQIWYSAKRQGELAARAMLGDDIAYRPPVFFNSAKFFDIEYTTVGDVARLPEGIKTFSYRVPGKEASIRIIEHQGAVIAFNMLGSRWDHTWFEKWIGERKSLAEVMENLHLAQFDVEFGRLPLAGARAAFAAGAAQ